MRNLLSFTCLTPIALIAVTPAFAETVVKDARTTPVRTTTANSGAPDSVTIDTTGSVTASVTSYGSAAAFQIGATDKAITVGAVSGNAQGHGLVINGSVSGQGVYKSVDGNGLVIGGLGQAVTIAGGMTVNAKIEASSLDKNATALRIGNLATVNEIVVNGGVGAVGGGIDPNSYVPDLGGWGFWLQQNVWSSSKDLGSTSAYDVSGWATAGVRQGERQECQRVSSKTPRPD